MSEKMWIRIGLAMVCGLALQSTASAHDGRPSHQTLTAMGLGGMQVMSDDEALSVRGEGFAVAWGSSRARVNKPVGGARSTDGYFSVGRHAAGGTNLSYAGGLFGVSTPAGTVIGGGVVFAGGSSSAWSL